MTLTKSISQITPMAASTSSPELLQAHVELWNLTYSYGKSMALDCAVDLGIPNAIHRNGGTATLADLLAVIPVPEERQPFLPRLMRFLVATGVLALDDGPMDAAGDRAYCLTPVSRLLVDDIRVNGCTSLGPFVLSMTTDFHVGSMLGLPAWFKGSGGSAAKTPFEMVNGMGPWDAMCQDPQVNKLFQDGMAADTTRTLDFVVTRSGEVFDGVGTMIDVGGGDGSSVNVIARAFPHVKCSVLDLPHVVGNVVRPYDGIEYIPGDMMSSIPPTDVVLLKYIMHDWSDEDCVRILKQCKKAICSAKPSGGGKVIIIDIVVGSPAQDVFQAQVTSDLNMMVMATGKEREEHEWRKIFLEAGFGDYKVRPVLALLSIIELYP